MPSFPGVCAWLPILLAAAGCADPGPQPEVTRVDDCFSCPAMAPRDNAPTAPLFITDRGADAVFRFSADGHLVEEVATALRRPSETRRGQDGALYVSSFGGNTIERLSGGETTTFFASSALEEPTTLFFSGGDLFVLGNDTRNVVIIGPDGELLAEAATELRGAHDMALGPDGRLYVATDRNLGASGCVQVWDPATGARVAVFGPELERATALAFDARGDLLVADYDAGTIVRYDPETRQRLELVARGLASPLDLAFDEEGALHVLTDRGVERVADGSLLVPLGPPLEAPRSITFL